MWDFYGFFQGTPKKTTLPVSIGLQGTASGACRGLGACCELFFGKAEKKKKGDIFPMTDPWDDFFLPP